MPLDLSHIAPQIEQLSALVNDAQYQQRIALAQTLLDSIDPDQLRAKLKEREQAKERIPWLVAWPLGALGQATPAPLPPANFSVVAADGSNVAPDRHSPVRFYVLNTGRVALGYGANAFAELSTQATLFYKKEELELMAVESDAQQHVPVEGAVLGAKMAIAELRALWETALAVDKPSVALSDGTLILWQIQTLQKTLRSQLIGEYIQLFEQFRRASIPVVSYVSRTGSRDVANALHSYVCPGKPILCKTCACEARAKHKVNALEDVFDYQLFGGLEPGERSEVFESRSQVLQEYGTHWIQFFYLNVGGEIARIEAPQWVMRDETMLHRIHAVIYDQCQRSGAYPPYPPILQEAHEQAVISTGDRRLIEQLVEEALQRQGLVYVRGAKDRSKRARTI